MVLVWYIAFMTRLRWLTVASLTLLVGVACGSDLQEDVAKPKLLQIDSGAPGEFEASTAATLFEFVINRARRLAQTSYSTTEVALPPILSNLSYDQYRSIRFRPEASVWRGESEFELQMFHPGYLYDESVRIHLVDDEEITELTFDPMLFRYEGSAAAVSKVMIPDLWYAGFRIHYPLNDAAIKDEVAVFLGASYFRLLGAGHVYGLSSRGLAVDIGLNRDEEFPDFRELWIVQPDALATRLTLYALLDSPSVTGAYRLDLEPGLNTALEVDARIFARQDVGKLGVAPMSSMFLYDQNRRPWLDDFRAQVHDSDGALVHAVDDEWLWRPLNNGPGTQVTQLSGGTPRGFGLLQRDRSFDNYLDLEASYQRRPSEWVDVEDEDWGMGHVELLTFETRTEFADNVAAYWVPSEPFRAGDERRYRYRLVMFDSQLPTQSLAQVLRTRVGQDTLTDTADGAPGRRRVFVVDFDGGDVTEMEGELPVAIVETSSGAAFVLPVQALLDDHGWRAAFRFESAGDQPADLRLHLEVDGRRLSETWNYRWYFQ
jgi:glucans biosynthesis protein